MVYYWTNMNISLYAMLIYNWNTTRRTGLTEKPQSAYFLVIPHRPADIHLNTHVCQRAFQNMGALRYCIM